MLITEFLQKIEQVIPLASAGYERDAVGLQVGLPRDTKLSHALITYELTDEVLNEAIAREANLIVAFHPLIFPSVASITDQSRTGVLIRKLILSEIALYVVHTAFDAHTEFGTSRLMAEVLELESIRVLAPLRQSLEKIVVFAPHSAARQVSEALSNAGAGSIGNYEECTFQVEGRGTFRGNQKSNPTVGERRVLESVDEVRIEMVCERWNTARAVSAMIAAHPYEEVAYDIFQLSTESRNFGMGAVGKWSKPKSLKEALTAIKQAFGTPIIRHSESPQKQIETVAMLGGAGMEYYSQAKKAGADLFLTADVRYHDFYRAEHDGLVLVDAGHAETERFVPQGMLRALRRALGVLETAAADSDDLILVSRTQQNAVRYF